MKSRKSRQNKKSLKRKSNNKNRRSRNKRSIKNKHKGGNVSPVVDYANFPGTTYPENAMENSEYVANYQGVYGGGGRKLFKQKTMAGGFLKEAMNKLEGLIKKVGGVPVTRDIDRANSVLESSIRDLERELERSGSGDPEEQGQGQEAAGQGQGQGQGQEQQQQQQGQAPRRTLQRTYRSKNILTLGKDGLEPAEPAAEPAAAAAPAAAQPAAAPAAQPAAAPAAAQPAPPAPPAEPEGQAPAAGWFGGGDKDRSKKQNKWMKEVKSLQKERKITFYQALKLASSMRKEKSSHQ